MTGDGDIGHRRNRGYEDTSQVCTTYEDKEFFLCLNISFYIIFSISSVIFLKAEIKIDIFPTCEFRNINDFGHILKKSIDKRWKWISQTLSNTFLLKA